MGKSRFPGFAKCMALMRSRHGGHQEDGFHWLRPHAAEFVAELVEAFRLESDNRGLKCWLLELIGEARSPRALDLFAEQLKSEDESLRDWAIVGLRLLDTPESRRRLFDAGIPR